MKNYPFRASLILIIVYVILMGVLPFAWAAQIRLAWDSNGEPDLAGYKVYYGTASRSYGTPVNIGNVTAYTLTGLTQGQTYYLSVTAYDSSSNESSYSGEVSGVATDPVQNVAITISTSPTGLSIAVDGTSYTAPQTFTWVVGSSHPIGVTSPQGTPSTRRVFSSWSDGGAQNHSITVPSAPATYTASFTTQHTLSTSVSPSGAGTVNPSGANWYNSGQSVSLSATASTGYSFSIWSGSLTHSTNPTSITMDGPKTVTSNFTQNQYTVTTTITPSGAGLVSKNPNKATYVHGEQVSLTATANSGYTFSNWSGDLTGSSNPATLTMNGNKAVTATFSAIAEAISVPTIPSGPSSGTTGVSYTFTTGGASSNLGHSLGYQFDWKGDGTDLSSWGTTSQSKTWAVAGDYRVRARARCATDTTVLSSWSSYSSVSISAAPASCTIITNPTGLQISVDGTVYTAPQTFNWVPGSTHDLSVSATQDGSPGIRNVYSSWSDGGARSHTLTVPSSPTNYTANFTTQYSLTSSVNPSGTGTVSPSDTNWYHSGQSVSLSATGSTGYSFSNWSGSLTHSTNPTSIIMDAPKTVTANFTQSQYTLTVSPNPSAAGLTTKNPNKSTYVQGEQVSLTATANNGYAFSNWTGGATGSSNPVSITMNGNKTVTANFTAVPETISVPTTPSGPNSGTTGVSYSYASGGSSSNLGHPVQYQFDWKGDGTDLSPWGSSVQSKTWGAAGIYNVRAKTRCATCQTVESSWSNPTLVNITPTPFACTITTNPSGLGISVNGTGYTGPQSFTWEPGSTYTIAVASPQDGTTLGTRYAFYQWNDGGAISHTITVPPSNTTYTATFTTQYSLTTSVNSLEAGSVSPSGTNWYNSGQNVSIAATANPGYSFTGWSGDFSSSSNPTTLTLDGPKNMVANFTAAPGSLVVTPSNGWSVSGGPGGPFNPSTYTCTLQNAGCTAITWIASQSQAWMSLSSTSGSLDPGASTTVVASLNETANSLAVGTYSDAVTFANTTNGNGNTTRPINLAVNGEALTYRIASVPSGLEVEVDGVVHKTPKKFKWTVGSSHALSAPSLQGGNNKRYFFSSWSDGGGQAHGMTAPETSTTYTAYFRTQYSLTTSVNVPEGGTVDQTGTFWFDTDQTVTLTAISYFDYSLRSWRNGKGEVIGKENPVTITMNSPKKIHAYFKLNTYPLVVVVDPKRSGSVTRSPKKSAYLYGEQVTLSANPNSGYLFNGWAGDVTGTDKVMTIAMDGGKQIYASFFEDPNLPQVAEPQVAESGGLSLIGELESPMDGKNASGVKAIYGWALDGKGISKIELFIDGSYVCKIPHGGIREDVKEAYPRYPKADQSGFAMIWNYAALSPGEHNVVVKVHNLKGETLDLAAKVNVVRFHGEVVTQIAPEGYLPYQINVTADGVTRSYDVHVDWCEETQDFGISEIIPRE